MAQLAAYCSCSYSLQLGRCHTLNDVRLNLICHFDIVEVLQTNTALETFTDLGDVILETSQRTDIAFPGNNAVANQTSSRIASYGSINHHAASDCSRFLNAEHFTNISLADDLLFLDGFEHSNHR